MTPFELGFVESEGEMDGLFWYNRILDIIFIVDVFLQFCVGIRQDKTMIDTERVGESPESEWERQIELLARAKMRTIVNYRWKAIAHAYITSWFPSDVLSLVPGYFDIVEAYMYANADADDGESESTDALRGAKALKTQKLLKSGRTLKLLKMTRAMRLLRVLRTSQNVRAFEEHLRVQFSWHTRKIALGKLLLKLMFACHTYACILGLTISFADSKIDTFWARHGYCWPVDEESGLMVEPTEDLLRAQALGRADVEYGSPLGIECVGMWRKYLVAMQQGFKDTLGLELAALDVTPSLPYPLRDPTQLPIEYFVVVVLGLIGMCFQLYLTGVFINVITAKELGVIERVTHFSRVHDLPWLTQRDLHNYFSHRNELISKFPGEALAADLSPRLAEDLMLQIHGDWLVRLPFARWVLDPPLIQQVPGRHGYASSENVHLRGGMGLLARIALLMKPALFIPNERPPNRRLYTIFKGTAFKSFPGQPCTLAAGESFGAEEVLIKTERVAKVKAITFLHVCYLEPQLLLNSVRDDPRIAAAFSDLKRWAFCVSLVDKVRTHMHETKRRRDNQIDGEAEETPIRQAVARLSSRLSSNEELHELQGVQLAKSRANSLIPDHEEPVHHQDRAYQA